MCFVSAGILVVSLGICVLRARFVIAWLLAGVDEESRAGSTVVVGGSAGGGGTPSGVPGPQLVSIAGGDFFMKVGA